MLEIYEQLHNLLSGIHKDVYKADNGNISAGTRVRKHMQDMKDLCQQMRSQALLKRTNK